MALRTSRHKIMLKKMGFNHDRKERYDRKQNADE